MGGCGLGVASLFIKGFIQIVNQNKMILRKKPGVPSCFRCTGGNTDCKHGMLNLDKCRYVHRLHCTCAGVISMIKC